MRYAPWIRKSACVCVVEHYEMQVHWKLFIHQFHIVMHPSTQSTINHYYLLKRILMSRRSDNRTAPDSAGLNKYAASNERTNERTYRTYLRIDLVGAIDSVGSSLYNLQYLLVYARLSSTDRLCLSGPHRLANRPRIFSRA